ncbi:hypothetical protein [Saccharibacillus qingshengii]|uniref:hypothetical protein n=1 Tax=Saccharibacillus qingshengii TaxID=1763540 RepID=UPI0015543122|nr:hypothetical protein [Saccharibacillus qingshengii]
MNTNVWVPLEKLQDMDPIWAGTTVRLYGVGLHVTDKSEDYYDYLVSYIYDNNEYLQLTNLSPGKAGNIICVIQMDQPHYYARAGNLKERIGIENTYVRMP